MAYSLRFKNLSEEFELDEEGDASWGLDVEDETELCRLLNRLAIATSNGSSVDFPEVEITRGTQRVLVTSIQGQLFFTDTRSPNRQNLKVVPEEIIRLLDNLPLEEVFLEKTQDAGISEGPRVTYRRSGLGPIFRSALFLFLCAVMGYCAFVVWRTVSYKPQIHHRPEFVAAPQARATAMLGDWADVYVSDYREGGSVLDLGRDGSFRRFEIWRSSASNILVEIGSGPAVPGMREGRPAISLDGDHVALLKSDGTIDFYGVTYRRHFGPLGQLGEIRQGP